MDAVKRSVICTLVDGIRSQKARPFRALDASLFHWNADSEAEWVWTVRRERITAAVRVADAWETPQNPRNPAVQTCPTHLAGTETAELNCGSRQFVHHHHRIRAIPLPGLQPRPARLHLLETPNKPVGVGCSGVSTTESAEFHCQGNGPDQLGTASTEPTEQACGSRDPSVTTTESA